MERKQLEKHLMLSQSTNHFSVMVPKQTIGCFVLIAQPFEKQFSTFSKNT